MKECDKSMGEFSTSPMLTLDEDYVQFKEKLVKSVTNTLKVCKPLRTKMVARLKMNDNIMRLRKKKSELFEKIKVEEDVERRVKLKRVNRSE